MSRVWRLVVLLVACLSAGCASHPPRWYFEDEKYLRFGVDPRDEAGELARMYGERGERVALRIVGHDFTAIGFMDRSGRATRARIVTGRGIVIALDPEIGTPLTAATNYALVAAPLSGTHDADGDGFEEVFIEARKPEGTCLLVERVRDVGYVDPVPTQFALFGRQRCPNGVADIDQDGRVELFADIDLVDFELPTPPRLRVVLWAERHRYVLRDEQERFAGYLAREESDRTSELATVRGKQRVPISLRIAVELAALAKLRELPENEQLERFDTALKDLPLQRAHKAWVEAARTRIQHGWSPAPPPGPSAVSAIVR
jgi:hypothetical protein